MRKQEDRLKFKAIVKHYIQNIRPKAQQELDWFVNQPSLKAAVSTRLAQQTVAPNGIRINVGSEEKRYERPMRFREIT